MGIFNNIDLKAMEVCTAAAAKMVIKVCGLSQYADLSEEELGEASAGQMSSCDAFSGNSTIGTEGAADFAGKSIAEKDSDIKVVGLLDFAGFKIAEPSTENNARAANKDMVETNKYYSHIQWTDMSGSSSKISNTAAQKILSTINAKIADLVSPTDKEGNTVKLCTQGRDLSQVMARDSRGRDLSVKNRRDSTVNGTVMRSEARYPRLLDDVIEKILLSGLAQAEKNYKTKLSKTMEAFDAEILKIMESKGGYKDESTGICWYKGSRPTE
jgi:hypothetical protein